MPDPTPIRAAFAGVTHPHADAWARALSERSDCEIVCVYDPDSAAAETFATRYGTRTIPGLQFGAEDNLDAVVVDGRNDQAPTFALAAIEANLPVFIEKTGAMNSAQLRMVADAAAERGLLTQMGYFLRYSDAVVEAKRVLESQMLGRLSLARFHAAIPHQAWTSMREWFGDSTNVVGPFMEAGCHLIDIVRHLLGEPSRVAASACHWQQPPNPSEDALAATMIMGETVVVVDFTAHEANPWNANWTIELQGIDRSFRAGLTPSRTELSTDGYLWESSAAFDLHDDSAWRETATAENALFMRRGMDAFVRALRGEDRVPVDAASGADTLALIEQIYRAARTDFSTTSSPATAEANSVLARGGQ